MSRRHPQNTRLPDGTSHKAPAPTPQALRNGQSRTVGSTLKPMLKLDTLATELLFEILENMDLKDALRLRLVCRRFAQVVLSAPGILRRSLRYVKAPLPYSPKPIHTLTGPEVISLCRRAFALETNWSRKLDRVRAHNFFPLHRPYRTTLAPGGRYLITAYHSTSGDEHSLNLYDLENKEGIVALASCPTETTLRSISAAWMEIKGKQGIAITWVRDLIRSSDRKPNVEVSVLFISLSKIEMLADPTKKRTDDLPFEFLCRRQWNTSFCEVSTEDGVLSVARSPGTLGFYDLETGQKSQIVLPPLPASQMPDPAMFGIKRLCDGTVLVIRGENGHSPLVAVQAIEVYRLPEWGSTVTPLAPLQAHFMHSDQFYYSISAMYRRQATSDNPSEEERWEASNYLPTVCISTENYGPLKGITQYRLHPIANPTAGPNEPKFIYKWPLTVWQGHYSAKDQHRTKTYHLPGADRSLGFPYTYPDRVWTPALSEFMVLHSDTDDIIPSVYLPEPIDKDVVQCVTWDETSGKLCLSTANDAKTWVLDFAV